MNSVFSEQILADKLSKLNNTQQCIETLSHWCIFHRTKAELVVATWDKQFHNPEKVQKIPFLYLANDILQNSKRNGNEFVTEFWKVLPSALKDVLENGDDHGKNVVTRLVDIWEERRVFGSRARGLKDIMFGKESPPPLEFNRKRSRSIRIVRRDSRSIKIKLAIGGTAEKVVSAFHSVLSEHPSEDIDINKCRSAVDRVRKMEKDVAHACSKVGDPKRMKLSNELEEEEALLKQCIEKLKSVEATRVALVSQLREALHQQESELENVRTQLQVAEAQVVEAGNMRKRLNNETEVEVPNHSSSTATPQIEETSRKTAAAIAAEVADKLAASSSSQLIMSSVLSTFAAEEAMNAGLATTVASSNSFASVAANTFNESRPKLEKPMLVSDPNAFLTAQPLNGPPVHAYQTVLVHQPPIQGQASTSQSPYHIHPNPPSQQYLQPSGGIVTGLPYGYSSLPPPPHMMSMPGQLTQQQLMPLTQQHQMPLIQQPPAPPSFRPLQPPGMLYYTHPHQH